MSVDLNNRGLKVAFGGSIGFMEHELRGLTKEGFDRLIDLKFEQMKLSLLDHWDDYKREDEQSDSPGGD